MLREMAFRFVLGALPVLLAGCGGTDGAADSASEPATGEAEEAATTSSCAATFTMADVPPGSTLDSAWWDLCVDFGGGRRSAHVHVADTRGRHYRVPANLHVELSENGAAKANSAGAVEPTTPIDIATRSVRGGHGHWCARLWNHAVIRGQLGYEKLLEVCKDL
jgi:hypothetical protein